MKSPYLLLPLVCLLAGWILANAEGGGFTEVELETEGGRKVYEFEIVSGDGESYEVEVAEDGTIYE